MTVCSTRTQKAKVLQTAINGFADHGGPTPAGLHVVVVPGFTSIKSKFCSRINEIGKPDSVPAWMGKNRQPACLMNRLTDAFSSESFSHCRISEVVHGKCSVIGFEAEGEHMHEATTQDGADFHAAPEVWNCLTEITLLLEPVLHRLERRTGMVIRDSQMSESFLGRLTNQSQRLKTPVTTDGMAMKIELTRAAFGANRLQNRPQRVVINRHGTPWRRRLRFQRYYLLH